MVATGEGVCDAGHEPVSGLSQSQIYHRIDCKYDIFVMGITTKNWRLVRRCEGFRNCWANLQGCRAQNARKTVLNMIKRWTALQSGFNAIGLDHRQACIIAV